jgi:hypothetical protein
MRPPSTFTPARSRARRPETAKGVADFLRTDDKMAALLPTAMRMAALQKDCASSLPAMFETCAILQFEAGQLVLSTPNAALAARLKNQLPKLQETLLQRGWQVSAIRLKVQVTAGKVDTVIPKIAKISGRGISAFAELGESLPKTKQNAGLLEALANLVQHKNGRR